MIHAVMYAPADDLRAKPIAISDRGPLLREEEQAQT